jgi:sigma-B regulation protein RsbU (phosphoserine phosphatase)
VYVADVELDYVYAELAETLWKTAFAGVVICTGSIILCWVLANHAASPMMKLAGVIRTVVARDFRMDQGDRTLLNSVAERSVEEVSNVAQAFGRMQDRLCEYIRELQESTAARQRIESELTIAHDIQMGLLPCNLPEVPGCELFARIIPAKEVGGDLFDAAIMPDGRLMIVVADVSGKGVPAGLFMAVAKTLLNVGRHYSTEPDKLMAFVNKELVAHNDQLMFVTTFVGMFDPKTGELQYTNAGHNPPYVRRSSGAIEMLEGRHGMALGIAPTAEFTTETATLAGGDLLLLYSDGVSEAQNEASELFDERRIEECLADAADSTAAATGAELLRRVTAFQGPAPQFDDITMLSLRYTAPATAQLAAAPTRGESPAPLAGAASRA